MKKTLQLSVALIAFAAVLAFFAAPLEAQTILTTTTLSSAVASSSTTSIQLTSSSGLTAGASVIFVADTASSGEMMFVNAVAPSGGYISVTRGYSSFGKARTHASGALVFLGPPFAFGTDAPSGSCTRSSVLYLPDISVGLGGVGTIISDCVGGVWVQGSGVNSAGPFFTMQVTPCSTAYTSCGTNTAIAAATSMYCSEIDVPFSKYATGLEVLNGATTGTDKHLVILYDGTGNLLANSATAGATSSGNSTWQKYAFTTPYYVVGPAKYYACAQSNGTTDKLQMLTTGQGDNTTTKAVTGQTFGTIAATFTVPSTFTTVVGPYWEFY